MVVSESGAMPGLDETRETREGKSEMGLRRLSVSELSFVRMTRERRFESNEALMEVMRCFVRGTNVDSEWE